ncbi:uncharacterized protein LOC124354418 [Homalodisca vitripennis]|nr:uncharacterized protein LOC124354418 [Homalodisca vitripennis]
MACDGGAVLKVIQLILCVVCLVYKRYTDNEAIKVFYHLEKLSREWPLLNNVTWDENGALLADVTFGGFAIVVLGLLIGQLTGELKRARRTVCFFLVLGCIMFLIVGGLCLAAIDQVPHHLVDNAIVLGVLSIITGLLFLLDLAVIGNRSRSPSRSSSGASREKKPVKVVSAPQVVEEKTEKVKGEKKDKESDGSSTKKSLGNGVLKELRSSLKRKKKVEDLDGRGVIVEKNERNVEFEDDKDSRGEPERLDRSGDEYRQYGRRRMDNRGFPRTASDDSGRFSSDRFRSDFVDAERDRRIDRDFDRYDQRNVSVVEGTYERDGRSRPASMMEVELDEHYLRPQDYYIEKKMTKEERRLQDQRISSSRQDLSDDEYQTQLPSVSFMLSERGRKVLPSVSTSPIERLHDVTSTTSPKPRYYYNSSRDPASGSSGPPSPRAPGYVLHTASQWGDPGKTPTTVSDRIQHWFKNRQPSKAP